MKKLINRHLYALMIMGMCIVMVVPFGAALGAEPDDEKLLNDLKDQMGDEDSLIHKVLGRFNFGLLVEAGVVYRDESAEGGSESDIALTTVEFGTEAVINDWVSSEVVLLFEDPTFDDEDASFDVDVGLITVGNTEQYPLYATVGKFYVPYGALLTHFPDDPLVDVPVTLTFGEISERALLAGYASNGWNLAAYAFNGSVKETGDDENQIDTYGADVNYTYESESDGLGLMVGASYLSNLADTDGISDVVPDTLQSSIGSMAAYLASTWQVLFLDVEYMSALDRFEATELATKDGNGAEPAVWNVEFGFNYDWGWERDLEVAFKYAGSDEAEGLEIPETRFGVALNQEVFDNTILSVGYLNDKFGDNILANGSEDKRQTLFSQLAVEF